MNNTKHIWKCSDIPGNYMCICGASGIWNRELQKIEVLEPVPEKVYERHHSENQVSTLS